jgi:hypothetical protein
MEETKITQRAIGLQFFEFIPGYAQRGKVSVLLVDVKKNTNAWITHGSVTRIDHGTMEKYWAAKLSCHIRFGPVGEFRLFGVFRQKEMRWGIFEQKWFWKVYKMILSIIGRFDKILLRFSHGQLFFCNLLLLTVLSWNKEKLLQNYTLIFLSNDHKQIKDYIEKRRGQTVFFSFRFNLLSNLLSDVTSNIDQA